MHVTEEDLQEKYWSKRYSLLLDEFSKMQRNYLKTLEELSDIRKVRYDKWVIIVDNQIKKE